MAAIVAAGAAHGRQCCAPAGRRILGRSNNRDPRRALPPGAAQPRQMLAGTEEALALMNSPTHIPRSISARARRCASGDRNLTYYRLDRSGLADLGRHADDGQGAARERAAQRRSWRRARGRGTCAGRLAAECRPSRPRCPSCRHACCCRTSPACRRWSISPRCATRWPTWAAIPALHRAARAGRPGHRPLGAGRSLPHRRRVRLQRRARIRAQRRALPAAALGAERLRRPARRAARHGHRPPGQPRVPRPGGRRARRRNRSDTVAFPDTLVGTDSHTTMVNGLGVLGYGVGGIEAEAALLGQPLYQPCRASSACACSATCRAAATATDLVLVISHMLRTHGVVGSFVEFCGDGLASLALADRATISNMAPEYGATAALFPIDGETLAYLRQTGRTAEPIDAGRDVRQGERAVARTGSWSRVRRAARARPGDRRADCRRPAPAAGQGRACPSCARTSALPTRPPPSAAQASSATSAQPATDTSRSTTARSPSRPSPAAPTPATRR